MVLNDGVTRGVKQSVAVSLEEIMAFVVGGKERNGTERNDQKPSLFYSMKKKRPP